MNEEEVLQKAAEVITSKPTSFTVSLKNVTWYEKLLIKFNQKQPYHKFTIKPLLVGNRYRIATRVVRMPDSILTNGLVKALLNPVYVKDSVYAVAVGIQNNDQEPSEELLQKIEFQFDDTDMLNALDTIFANIPIEDFIKSIILMKGANVLNAKEKDAPLVNTQD